MAAGRLGTVEEPPPTCLKGCARMAYSQGLSLEPALGRSMQEDDIALFNDSLTRCTNEPRFLERFYELFLASSDEVREKFEKTDFPKQMRLLKASFHMLLLAADGRPEGHAHMERLAELHSRKHLDIPPHLYDLWLDSLLHAVRECDPHFSERTAAAWRQMMEPGVALLKARYDPEPGIGPELASSSVS